MHHFVNLGVSVSILLSFEKLDLIHKLINIPQLVYVFENKSGNILSIENFKISITKLITQKKELFPSICNECDLDNITCIHFIYNIFSIVSEHTGSIFENSFISIDTNISKIKQGKRIFKSAGIDKSNIKIGYTLSNYV